MASLPMRVAARGHGRDQPTANEYPHVRSCVYAWGTRGACRALANLNRFVHVVGVPVHGKDLDVPRQLRRALHGTGGVCADAYVCVCVGGVRVCGVHTWHARVRDAQPPNAQTGSCDLGRALPACCRAPRARPQCRCAAHVTTTKAKTCKDCTSAPHTQAGCLTSGASRVPPCPRRLYTTLRMPCRSRMSVSTRA
jgi:hypothetical protein